jgi:hypothetical protein
MRTRHVLILFSSAFVISIISTLVYDVSARVSTAGDTVAAAIRLHFLHIGLWEMLLFLPFFVVAWMGRALAVKGRPVSAYVLAAVGFAVMSWLYYGGYHASQSALLQEKWTASALSVGLLPFQAAAAICVLFLPWGALMYPASRAAPPPSTSD